MLQASYPTDLTDAQWTLLKPMLPKPSACGRPPADARTMMDGIFYVLHGGIQWRRLPKNFGPWSTVHGTYRRWRRQGLWAPLNARLRAKVRAQHHKRSRPTACILDSQTVRSADHGGAAGYDAAKKPRAAGVISWWTLWGCSWACCSPRPARRSGWEPRGCWRGCWRGLHWLRKLWADGGYSGPEFAQWVRQQRPKLEVQIVKRSDDVKGFVVLPRRWVVERTFGWLMKQRRLVRDYETLETSAEAWVYLAMIRIMLRRLA